MSEKLAALQSRVDRLESAIRQLLDYYTESGVLEEERAVVNVALDAMANPTKSNE